jgi:telomerase protein component 1
MAYDEDILKRYKVALDNALKVATTYNISPVKGNTCILLNLSSKMMFYLASNGAKSLGKKVKTVADIAALMALMFKYSCEYSKLIVFTDRMVYTDIELSEGTILDNMKKLTDIQNNAVTPSHGMMNSQGLGSVLKDILSQKEYFDNVILLSNGLEQVDFFKEFLRKYRSLINDQLLFVNVNLSVSDCNIVNDVNFTHEMDVCISGFSDSILRFVAERGNQGQLVHIDNIDKSYELPELKELTSSKKEDNLVRKNSIERPKFKINIPVSLIYYFLILK